MTSSALRDSFPKKQVRGLPAYDVPVILLARLAVDRRFGGRGLGRELLAAALRVSLSVSKEAGCRCIIVDAYPTATDWYRRYGFSALEENKSGAVRMYLDIRTIEAARPVS